MRGSYSYRKGGNKTKKLTRRCYGGSGGTNSVIPQAQHTAYPPGASTPSEAAKMHGDENVNAQSEMISTFSGGSGHQPIVVPQHQEIANNESGEQGPNQTTVTVAKALSQGNENASMDELVGGGPFSIRHSKKPYGQAPKTHTTQGSIPRPMGRGGKKRKSLKKERKTSRKAKKGGQSDRDKRMQEYENQFQREYADRMKEVRRKYYEKKNKCKYVKTREEFKKNECGKIYEDYITDNKERGRSYWTFEDNTEAGKKEKERENKATATLKKLRSQIGGKRKSRKMKKSRK